MKLVRCRFALGSLALLFLAVAQPPLLHAQYQKYEGLTIANIRFDPPDQPLDASELHDILPLQIGKPLHISEVRRAIDRLFATGRYVDIQVDAEPYNGGVAITIRTKSRWFIGAVSVSGNPSSPPTPGQLENAANLDLGAAYSETKLQAAVAGQERLLQNNGLFRGAVKVFPDWDTTAEYQQVNINFGVQSGPRAHFTTPVFTGDLKLDTERLLKATKFRRWIIHTWKPMTQVRVRQALDSVRSLYERENRLEAKVSLESVRYDPEANAAVPTLHVEAGPHIQINTFGAKVSQGKLRRLIPVYEEHAVDRDLLAEGARNLTDYLQSRGFFDAEVQFKQQAVIRDKANIDYLINEGPRHRLVFIGIDGNKYFTTASIRERMFLQTSAFLQAPHGRYSEGLLRGDRDTIANLYQSNGFRDVRVTSDTADNYRGKKGDLAVFLHIDEGQQYFIADLQIDGIEHLDREKLRARLSSSAGQPFSEFSVAVDRDTILAQYFESGFPRPTFEWSTTPSAADPHRFNLHYVIHEGRQQFVRQVIITGNRVTRWQLINRNITLNPGDPLSPTEMTNIQRSLYGLGVFSRVDTAIQDPDGEGDQKYVLYNVEEARRYSMAVGFGAAFGRIGGCDTCLDAPAGSTGFAPRISYDVSRNNLWGLTHSISLRTRVSTLEQRGLLNYSWPRFRGSDNLTVSFTGLYQQSRDIRTFNFRREEGSAQLNQKLSKATTILYRYTYRRVSVSDLKITPLLLPFLSQAVRVGIAQINVIQDRRDDAIDPHKGVYNTLDLGLADRVFGSQRNFLRFLVRNATYHQLTKRFVLARSTEFGDIYSFRFSGDPLEAVPLPERFFGGGGTSHRGFPEFQAGPRDTSTGFPLGGTALFFNQTELRFPLIGESIGGVLFHDMGNVYSSVREFSFRVGQRDLSDFDYMVHAVGFGVRYKTPVGPVRVDLGYSINPPYFYGWNGTQNQLLAAGVNPCQSSPSLCSVKNVSHFQFIISLGQTF
jgi:outer membrane protein insertion porin family